MSWGKILTALFFFSSASLFAADVGTADALQTAIVTANGGGDNTINFTANITLSTPLADGSPFLQPLNTNTDFTSQPAKTITIDGAGFFLDGASSIRGLFANGGTVVINDLLFQNTKAQGGGRAVPNSGAGGGGFGGGLFVANGANVTLKNATFTSCNATGGAGGTAEEFFSVVDGGGGGGFNGNGGQFSGGGGGFGGNGGGGFGAGGGGAKTVGINGVFPNTPSNGGGDFAGANFGVVGVSGGNGGNGGGGAGSVAAASTSPAGDGGLGGGGGGGNDSTGTTGGNGGEGGSFGGGGGGASETGTGGNGGSGKFAGAGGSGGGTTALGAGTVGGNGGNGGFGGGGGGSGCGETAGTPGTGGFGGGTGGVGATDVLAIGGSGGGAGFGGAIFIQNEGSLTIQDSIIFSGNTATAGAGGAKISGSGNATPGTNGSAAGADIFIMSEGEISFELSSPVSLANPIEGDIGAGGGLETTGGLVKKGSALLTLNGDNTYTGVTSVTEGELQINGSVITETTVSAGATLSGSFTAKKMGTNPNSGNVTNSGTFSPGSSVGTVTIEGDYQQLTTDSRLIVDITPTGTSDKLIINAGSATLDGTLEVVVGTGNYIQGTTYEIINAPTNGTQFSSIVESGPDAPFVRISVDYSSVILTVLNNHIFEDQLITSSVAKEVVKCITSDAIRANSDFALMVEILGTLSNSEVNAALEALSPAQFGALEWINARNNSYIADILSQHMFELCCSPRDCCSCDYTKSVWITGFGNFMDNHKTFDNLEKFDATAAGVLVGVDFCCSPCFYFGGSVGYTHTNLDWNTTGGRGTIHSYYGALYGSGSCGCFTGDFSFIGGGSDHNLKRKIEFSTVDRTANSHPWGYFFTAHLGGQYGWDCGCTTFEPFVLADYHYFDRDSFEEHGANSLNLDVKGKTQHMIRAEAGLRGYYTVNCDCFCYAPYFGVSWVGEFPLHSSEQKANFRDQSCVMNVTSYDSAVHLGSPEAGVKVTNECGFSFLIGYKGLFNGDTRINQAEARIEWIF